MRALGVPIRDGGQGAPRVALRPYGHMLTTSSRCFSTGVAFDGMGVAGQGGVTWYAANGPVAIPFVLAEPVTVYQLGWYNSSAGDNEDVGIYDTAWNRLVSTGSTACTGGNTFQFADVADTLLLAGRYYLVVARDTTVANRTSGVAVTQPGAVLLGLMDSATAAFPLPNPLTNMVAAATVTFIPRAYIALRALV